VSDILVVLGTATESTCEASTCGNQTIILSYEHTCRPSEDHVQELLCDLSRSRPESTTERTRMFALIYTSICTGAGFSVVSSTVTLSGTTSFSNNFASGSGGALYASGEGASIEAGIYVDICGHLQVCDIEFLLLVALIDTLYACCDGMRYTFIYTYVHTYIHIIDICTYVCMYIYIYIYIWMYTRTKLIECLLLVSVAMVSQRVIKATDQDSYYATSPHAPWCPAMVCGLQILVHGCTYVSFWCTV
jgi:predicted outer membrane repeat protein